MLGAAQLALAEGSFEELDGGFEERYDADAGHYVLALRCADAAPFKPHVDVAVWVH